MIVPLSPRHHVARSKLRSAIQSRAIIPALAASLVASAAATAFALRTGTHAWLGCLSLVPLFAAIRWLAPISSSTAGALWGLCLLACCRLGLGPSIDATFWPSVLLVLVPAAYCGLGSALTRWIGFSPFVLGVAWMGVEFALIPIGLHEGLLSGSQEGTTIMNVGGRALGYVFVGFVIAYVNALLIEVFGRVPFRFIGICSIKPASRAGRRLRPQVAGCVSVVTFQPSHPRAPPLRDGNIARSVSCLLP